MTAPTHLPEPLEFSPLAQGLLYSLAALGPRETILAHQAAWAAAHLLNMMADPPAQPDTAWLRLFTTADRVYHRNLRQLDRLQARRPAQQASPAPRPAQAAAPVASPPAATPSAERPTSSDSRIMPRPTPRQSPSRRPDPSHRPRPNLELLLQSAADSPLPLSATPTGTTARALTSQPIEN